MGAKGYENLLFWVGGSAESKIRLSSALLGLGVWSELGKRKNERKEKERRKKTMATQVFR